MGLNQTKMNKTININLGGVFFHIDEDAYKKLQKYLEAIRKSLSDDPQGKDEIINDIEIRIGEILSESVKDVRQVVNEQDIDDIIIIMGKPEEYAGDEEFFEDETYKKTSRKGKSKKLFRDSDDKFLGGVSSGLAHYFNIDTIWVRLLWLLLMYKGTGVILYLILWILLPETKSTSDKLEMEGEDVNISNIEKKIRSGFNDASQILKDGVDDVSTQLKNGNYQGKVKSGLQEIIDLFAKVFTSIFKVTGKFIGVLLIIISVLTLFTVVAGGFSLGSIEFLGLTDELTRYPPFFYTSRLPAWLLATFGFILIGIPFVFLFKLGLKIISNNVNRFSRATNLSLLGIWLIAIMGFAFAGIEYGAHSANKFSTSEKFNIEHLTIKDTLNIKMIALEEFTPKRYSDEKTVFIGETERAYRTNIKLDIRESNSDYLYLKTYKKANAISEEKAKELTSKIDYKFEVINNTLMLDAYFLSDLENRYDSQYIRMTLYVPKGMTVYLDKSTKYFLNDVENYQKIYDRDMIKHYYAMDDEGLDCLDCNDKSEEKEKETTSNNKTKINDDVKKNSETTNISDDPEEVAKKVRQKLKAKQTE
jgi:phage shock protein PspC (stress-responsive transcriptional regulator)